MHTHTPPVLRISNARNTHTLQHQTEKEKEQAREEVAEKQQGKAEGKKEMTRKYCGYFKSMLPLSEVTE